MSLAGIVVIATAIASATGTATTNATATGAATPTSTSAHPERSVREANAESKGTPPPFTTAADLGDFITGYYRSPRPDRLVDALAAADRLGVVGEATAPTLAAFAGAVLSDHPELIARGTVALAGASTAGQLLWWRSVWTSGTPEALAALATAVGETAPVRDAIDVMRRTPPPDALIGAITSPGDLDVLWARFFATGDGRPVVRIASLLGWEKDADAARRTIGAAARWSLRTNAEAHPRVRELLEVAAKDGAGVDRELVSALLAEKGPPEPPRPAR